MTAPSPDLSLCLADIGKLRAALKAGQVEDALSLYSSRYSGFAGRSLWEWRLAKAILQGGSAVKQLAWPRDLLERPSGATLAFVVAQLSGQDLALPAGLARLAPIPLDSRQTIAASWERRPECSCLGEMDFRHRFALWLSDSPEAIGPCLLAAAQVGDGELIERLGPLWLARGIFHAGAPEQIEQASRLSALKAVAGEALGVALGTFLKDPAALLRLLGAASSLRRFHTALALGELILEDPELASEQKPHVLTLLLGALAELDRFEETAAVYRERWIPLAIPFPQPEWLLYAFQRSGESSLEQHLLESVDAGAQVSAWVRLRRDLLRKGAPDRSDLEGWEALYGERGKDERILVGISEAVLRSAPLLREEWRDRLGLLTRWRALADIGRYRLLAGSYLVLLQPTDAERIEAFERLLEGAPLVQEPVRRAARAYVAALRRTRRWDRLRDLARSWPDLFNLACPFKERELARLLGRLIDLPVDEPGFRLWCAGWERGLSLPLSGREVAEVLGHFVLLRRELERRDPEMAEDDLLSDIQLQVLRRAKAEAERRLAWSGDLQTRETLRSRLRAARLEATLRILEEDLDPLGDEHV